MRELNYLFSFKKSWTRTHLWAGALSWIRHRPIKLVAGLHFAYDKGWVYMTEPTWTFNEFCKTERIRPKFHPIIENHRSFHVLLIATRYGRPLATQLNKRPSYFYFFFFFFFFFLWGGGVIIWAHSSCFDSVWLNQTKPPIFRDFLRMFCFRRQSYYTFILLYCSWCCAVWWP